RRPSHRASDRSRSVRPPWASAGCCRPRSPSPRCAEPGRSCAGTGRWGGRPPSRRPLPAPGLPPHSPPRRRPPAPGPAGRRPARVRSARPGRGRAAAGRDRPPRAPRSRADPAQPPGGVLLGALAVALYPLAFYSSMHLAGVAVGSAISLASAPLASGLLERWIDRAPLSRWWMLAAGLGIAGSLALCASTLGARPAAAAPTPLGIGLGLVAGATYATFSWSVHRLLTAGIARPAA